MQIANLIKTSKKSLKIEIANVHKHADYSDCGVFAVAYCTALAHDQDPSKFIYKQESMRKHLELCLSNKRMEPFPIIRQTRSLKPKYDTVDV